LLLIVQIPCFNEEETIGSVLEEIPREVWGIDRVEVLVVDDGSKDASIEEAKKAGADHVVSFSENRGLARTFEAGLDAALKLGADIIVNIDADGQYKGEDIPVLIKPIIEGSADVVVGDRGIINDKDYPTIKKALQIVGSRTVRFLSNTETIDATSGFRAYSREAAQKIHLISDFTYTLESLIQAGSYNLRVKSVPISVRKVKRPSRLFSSMREYLFKSAVTIIRVYSMFEPIKVFFAIGGIIFTSGFGIGMWFLFYYFTEGGKGHVQMLILAAVLMIIGFQVLVMGLLADLIASNRKLIADVLFRIKRIEHDKQNSNPDESDKS
jgi:glycosyltransferase involved in cell wall biosynthesis